MRKFVTTCVLVLGALFVAQALVPLLLFAAPWGGVLLHLYVSIGVALLIQTLILRRLGQDELRTSFEQELVAMAGRQANVGPRRSAVLTASFVAQFIVCWPAFMFGRQVIRIHRSGANIDTDLRANAAASLFPYESSVSAWLLVATLATTLIALWTAHASPYAHAFLWLAVAAIACKHLSVLLAPIDAQQRLRRSADPVIASYVFLTLADLAALVLAYNGVLNWKPQPTLSAVSLKAIYDQLQVFKDVFNAWQHLPAQPSGYLLGLSGLLWLLTLANSLMNLFSNHKRTADDQLAIAIASTVVGMDAQAVKALDAVDPQTRLQFDQKGEVLAALGSFEKADEYLGEYLRQLSIGAAPPTPDHRFVMMFSSIAQLSPRLTSQLGKLIAYCADKGASQTLFCSIALSTKVVGGDPMAIARVMEERALRDRFPLAFAVLMWSSDREPEILGLFDALLEPSAGAEHFAWRCVQALLIPARAPSAQAMAAAVEAWDAAAMQEFPGDVAASTPLHCHLVLDLLARVQVYVEAQSGRTLASIPPAAEALNASRVADALVKKSLASAVDPAAPPAPSGPAPGGVAGTSAPAGAAH